MRSGNFIALEAEATSVRVWEPTILPGLLQTPDYMRALMNAWNPAGKSGDVDRHVELRLARQARLTADDDDVLYLSAIFDDSVPERLIGGSEVMQAQLRHLLALAKRPNVDLQILPWISGEHGLLGDQLRWLSSRSHPTSTWSSSKTLPATPTKKIWRRSPGTGGCSSGCLPPH